MWDAATMVAALHLNNHHMSEKPPIYSEGLLLTLDEGALAEYLQKIMEWFGENFHDLTPVLALQYSTVGIRACNLLAQMEGDDSFDGIADTFKTDTELIQIGALKNSINMLDAMRYPN